jgi:hypothetical protein
MALSPIDCYFCMHMWEYGPSSKEKPGLAKPATDDAPRLFFCGVRLLGSPGRWTTITRGRTILDGGDRPSHPERPPDPPPEKPPVKDPPPAPSPPAKDPPRKPPRPEPPERRNGPDQDASAREGPKDAGRVTMGGPYDRTVGLEVRRLDPLTEAMEQ